MKRYNTHTGWIIVAILAIIPVLIWLTMLPFSLRFGSIVAIFTSLGQVAGLVGIVLFAISLILSARLKFFDRHLSGLNRVYLNHSRIGAIAFILLLFHPLFLTVQYLSISLPSAASFLFSFSYWPTNFGKIALFAMIVLLVLTLFVSLRYHVWKKTHKYLGVAFFIASLHAFLIPSDISMNLVLRWYVLSLSALGIVAYIYRTILGRFLVKRYLYTVAEVKQLNAIITEIALVPFQPNKTMPYAPGQFAFISFADPLISSEQHPFSIVSTPESNELRFAIKKSGDYTRHIEKLQKGVMASIEGAYGKFTLSEIPNKRQIWIAGGIGITPFVSMAQYLFHQPENKEYAIDLYYCVRNDSELAYQNLLAEFASNNKNFHLISFCSDMQGRINAKVVQDTSNGLENKDILICGPSVMMRMLREQLGQLGVSKRNIHSEDFQLT